MHQKVSRCTALLEHNLWAMITPPNTPLTPPVLNSLCGEPYIWSVPGSKSLTNRAFIAAALSSQACELRGVLHSDDTRHMRRCLEQLGVMFTDLSDDSVAISCDHLHESPDELFVGNSGTTVRFLSALAATIPGTHRLVGDQHMAKRPIADLVDALRDQGVQVDCPTGCPPLTISGSGLKGGTVRMAGHRSSQYFTALMLVAHRAHNPLTIEIAGSLVSRPYVTMTAAMLSEFGLDNITVGEQTITTQPGTICAQTYTIEPDASAASYPLALAAALGTDITIPHLHQNALQGDVAFVDILQQMGAQVSYSGNGIRVAGSSQLAGVDVDMEHISDTVMTLAAIAPLASSPTTIRNVANIRIKETDRLQALVNELQKLGQDIDYGDDWIRITPQPITRTSIECYADHRIAMSFAILGLCSEIEIEIDDPACVAKTYPGFWQDLAKYAHHCGVDWNLPCAS